MALDKMKGVLDASGASVAMMSVKRGGNSGRTHSPSSGKVGLMKKMTGLGLASLRRGSRHSAPSSSPHQDSPEEEEGAQPIDSIPGELETDSSVWEARSMT